MIDLYRFYDNAGKLLYVGISLNAAHRAISHRDEKTWWGSVHRMEVEHLDVDRRQAEEIERAAIIAEAPLHNIRHNGVSSSEPHKERMNRPPDDIGVKYVPLVGLYVLTPHLELGWPRTHYQGEILEMIEPGTYLVQWFSWFNGCPTSTSLVAAAEMMGNGDRAREWRMYTSHASWVEAGERSLSDGLAEVTVSCLD